MKRFRFRLETVLRVRSVREEQARARLVEANRAADAAAALVSQRRDHYATLERPAGVQHIHDVERLWFGLDAGAGALTWARAEQDGAAARATSELAAWSSTKRSLRTVERLRARAYDAHVGAVRREDDRLSDELATSRATRGGPLR